MPQQPSGAGEDLAAGDETISFKDEGGPGEIPTKKLADSTTSSRDLNDIKSSLVTEGECKNSSDDQRGIKRLAPDYGESVKDSVKEQPLFRIYDTVGGSSKLDHFRYGQHYRFFTGGYPSASMLPTAYDMPTGTAFHSIYWDL
ncbi:transcription factor 7-like 2 isoform X2 [Anneissia japonica]|uniref:transcription factor 7-like 2 isoform X2 n=1 Tax=Anneissia japonica TaxID=1529436 RepID=UPI001425A177|nr:transcription factor 7-like 2 isoform X2 [Anneissia japonica]